MSKDDFTEFDAWWNNVRDPRDFCGYFEARDAWTAAIASRQEQPASPAVTASPVVQEAALEAAFMYGFFSVSTYNDTRLNDYKSEWEEQRESILAALAAAPSPDKEQP